MKKYELLNDETLVEICLLGKSDAYEELVLRHENAVMNTVKRYTSSRFIAEDASQEAFVSAWMHLDALRDRSKFKPWVCAIAKNCVTALVTRYRSVVPDISLSLVENEELTEDPDSELSALITSETVEELHAMVDALSEKLRETIRLHYFGGYTVNEIAERLSVPAGTVKWRLSEGRKQLRKGYRITEMKHNGNDALVSRVMKRVEELKLWNLKKSKNGFEDDYKNALTLTNELPDGKKRSRAMADILLLGYWWMPGQKNDQVLAEIKKHAEQSKNEEVMISVIANEADNYSGDEYNKFMLETEMPYTQKFKMKKAEAYCWFWLGNNYISGGETDKGFECFNKVLELLTPADDYYANAKSAIAVEKKRMEIKPDNLLLNYNATGEVYRYINGKLYFIRQPGYGNGGMPVFWYASLCDGLIYDPDLKQGDTVVSSDGLSTLICESTDETVSTRAGVFEHCTVYSISGNFKTAYCPGVGIVYSEYSDLKVSLTKYTVKGGDGMIPFYPGNRWEYEAEYDDDGYDQENVFEVTSYINGEAVVSAYSIFWLKEDAKTFTGIMRYAANRYVEEGVNNQVRLVEVRGKMKSAETLAKTKKQKVWFQAAYDVMDRIFNTDPEFTPECNEKGLWNFFNIYDAKRKGGTVCVSDIITETRESFEWKGRIKGAQPFRLLYNSLYTIVQDGTGCVWCDKWMPGYTDTITRSSYGTPIKTAVSVVESERVRTPAGTFENCRHVNLDVTGFKGGLGYFGGHMECWYAEGVGLVKYKRPVNDEVENVWELTGYEGKGDGFFPINDGLVRRYEPKDIGDGCRGFVEYTFVDDEGKTFVFKNACGVQGRGEFEKSKEKNVTKKT